MSLIYFISFFCAVVDFKSDSKAIWKQILYRWHNLANYVTNGQDVKTAAKRCMKEAGSILVDRTITRLKTMNRSNKINKMCKGANKIIISLEAKKMKTRYLLLNKCLLLFTETPHSEHHGIRFIHFLPSRALQRMDYLKNKSFF